MFHLVLAQFNAWSPFTLYTALIAAPIPLYIYKVTSFFFLHLVHRAMATIYTPHGCIM